MKPRGGRVNLNISLVVCTIADYKAAQINKLVDELTELRIYVEAAIDFVDERQSP
jgi:tRNA U34 5-carboxymethylaminomethyl modifying GTPase MnmE/TrmE